MTTAILFFLNLVSAIVIFFTSGEGTRTQIKDLITPPPEIEHYSFGMRPQVADFMWVRSIQDIDYCDEQVTKLACKGQSWLFHMLDAVVRLDPHYKNAYSAGGMALTILISDYEGASKIFDKGVVKFPNDWPLLYRAAYHALYEEHNYDKASDLYRRVAENGGPEWGVSLGKRLRTKKGQIEIGERMLGQMIERGEDEKVIKRFREKIDEIKKTDTEP